MALPAGTRIGTYEIVSQIGAGGMGDVYRARDSRLGRDVALKVLPEAFADDGERRARFEREARTLAALNHPNIAAIYGVETAGDVSALAMELVDGTTLAELVGRGPIPVAEAIRIARQMIDALEAAHDKGIVHRDLKPANIMLSAEGQVKVLDFGLAKTTGSGDPQRSSAALSLSPTMMSPAGVSSPGMLLGTAAYMSPEQAKGREADKRSDVWSFGCVLYEMLTGKAPFGGEDVSDLLAAVLRGEPDWSALPASVPRYLRAILTRCLEKDRKRRIPDLAVVRFLLDEGEAAANTHEAPAPRSGLTRRERVVWAIALLGCITMGALAARLLRESPAPPQTIRFEVSPPEGGIFPGADSTPRMALSPDGRYLAFTANLQDGKPDQLWIRRLDSLDATQLTSIDTMSGEPAQQPFWSPDSRFVGFFHEGKLKKVDIEGRVVQTLCSVPGNNFGGAWNSDGMILFGSSGTEGLQLVSAGGGVPTPVTTLEASSKELRHLWPRFLPDGRHFMYQAQGESTGDAAIFVAALDTPGRTPVIASAHMVEFAPPDRLLFVRDDALLAQRFDVDTLELRGDPVAVTESVQMAGNGRAGFTVSATGVLAYRSSSSGGRDIQLAWLDRSGREVGLVGEPATFRGLELSPDDRLIAVHKEESPGTGDLWVVDLERGSSTRLTFDAQQHNTSPTWSPDGRRIIFAKRGGGAFAVYERDATGVGDERLIYESKPGAVPWSVSPDGKTLVITENQGVTGIDLRTVALDGSDTPVTFANAPALQAFGQLSPDGRWIAYASGESGRQEVYVRSFPAGETRYQISADGGTQPRWRTDGRELFYRANAAIGQSALLVVSIEPEGDALRFDAPKPLFERFWPGASHVSAFFGYDVTSDGQRLLVARPAGEGGATLFETPITVVVNWDGAFR